MFQSTCRIIVLLAFSMAFVIGDECHAVSYLSLPSTVYEGESAYVGVTSYYYWSASSTTGGYATFYLDGASPTAALFAGTYANTSLFWADDGVFTVRATGTRHFQYTTWTPGYWHRHSFYDHWHDGFVTTHNSSENFDLAGTVTVLNRAPQLQSITSDLSIEVGEMFQFTTSAKDVLTDPLTAAWDLDNDSEFDDFTGWSGMHSFSAPGQYQIRTLISDDDGGSTLGSLMVNVTGTAIPTPAAAFVGLAAFAMLALRRPRRGERQTITP